MKPFTWQELADKADWEGGILDVLGWGGVSCFPVEAQEDARTIQEAVARIEAKMPQPRFEDEDQD